MKVQIYSDLHIEFYKTFPKIEPLCDILILAGDIGSIYHNQFKPFFDYVSMNWKKIYYILGNHEYYGSNHCFYKTQKKYVEYFTNYDNIFLLDREKSILSINDEQEYGENRDNIDNVVILGTTLWSQANDFSMKMVNCFKKIKYYDTDKNRKFNITKQMYNSWNKEEESWIFSQIKQIVKKNIERKVFETVQTQTQTQNLKSSKTKIIIVTHYPMTQKNSYHNKYKDEPQNVKDIFANNIDFEEWLNNEIINYEYLENIEVICISGHTHYSHDFYDNFTIFDDSVKKIGEKSIQIRFISNQMGYKEEIVSQETGFSINGLYDL